MPNDFLRKLMMNLPNQWGGAEINPIPNAPMGVRPQPIPVYPDEQMGFRNQMMSTPALDEYSSHMGAMPQRQNYKPSIWRKLAAAIAGTTSGFGNAERGFNVSSGIVNAPYDTAMTDWSNRGAGLKDLAGVETKNFAQENNQLRNLFNYSTQSQRNQITQDRNDTLGRQGDTRLGIQQTEAETKAANAKTNREYIDAKIKNMSKGNYSVVSSRDGTEDFVMDKTTGKMTKLDVDLFGEPEKVQKQIDAALERMREQVAATDRRTDVVKGNAELSNKTRQAIAELQQENKVNTGAVGQQRLADQNAIQEVVAKNPGWNNKWASKKGTVWTITPPDSETTDPAEQQDFHNFYDEYKRYKGKSPTTVVSPPKKVSPPKASGQVSSGTVRMTDGKQEYDIPADQVAAALKDGLRRK